MSKGTIAFPIAHGKINEATVPPYIWGNNVHVVNDNTDPHRPSITLRKFGSGVVMRNTRYRKPNAGNA